MNKTFVLAIAAILTTWFALKPSANALDLHIEVGDRPYYEGPTYWDAGYEWVWIAGHREHGHWVHGRYERRGAFHREHVHAHHHHHHHHD
jgi:hypothetical protein